MTGSWKGRGNQYTEFVRVLYFKLPTNAKQLPAFPLEAVPGIEPRPQRWEARVLQLCHRGPGLGSRNMAQLISGSSLYSQRKDQLSQNIENISHSKHKLITFMRQRLRGRLH